MTTLATQQVAPTPPADLAPKGKAAGLINVDESPFANLLDTNRFEHMWRVAQMYAATKFVPECYQGKANDCFVALQMAVRLGVDPMMFMQKTYIVHGKPGMEATLVIALINSRGPFTGPIQFTYAGEGMKRQCTAHAIHQVTGQACDTTVTMEIAKAEGWIDKPGSKWKTMPDQMLAYRSAAWFGRRYCPECLLGMETTDERDDIGPIKIVQNLAIEPEDGRSRSDRLLDKLKNPANAAAVVAAVNGAGATDLQAAIDAKRAAETKEAEDHLESVLPPAKQPDTSRIREDEIPTEGMEPEELLPKSGGRKRV